MKSHIVRDAVAAGDIGRHPFRDALDCEYRGHGGARVATVVSEPEGRYVLACTSSWELSGALTKARAA